MVGGRGENLKIKKELARKKMEAAVPLLRSQKHTKQKVDG